jgi:hypothetical protein
VTSASSAIAWGTNRWYTYYMVTKRTRPQGDEHEHGSWFGDAVERMNSRLRPYIGGAQLGIRDEAPIVAPAHGGACPLCGAPMDRHIVDRTGPRTMLHCPRDGAE